ncbi:MAG: hypothetical protein KGL39_46395 [Patescibacteria group bacterium]|nr:hypothetical protein [Patescibacteria group bacterium]
METVFIKTENGGEALPDSGAVTAPVPARGFLQITIWEWPMVRLRSQYGVVSFEEWCRLEVERAADAGRRFFVGVGDGIHRGKICLEAQPA